MPDFQFTTHFPRTEIQCKCCGLIGSYPANLRKLIDRLELLRHHLLGKPIHITSAYRCPKHNKAVGGVPKSYHTQAMAADIYVEGMTVDDLADAARECGFGGVGRYRGAGFVHVDVGPASDWSE